MDQFRSSEELPLAEPPYEETAQSIFGPAELAAEEWVARYAHTVGCSSFDQYRYRDAALQRKVYRIHELLRSPGAVDRCRREFLTTEELEEVLRRAAEPF